MKHLHDYKRISVEQVTYFECECGSQTDEATATEYFQIVKTLKDYYSPDEDLGEYLHNNYLESMVTGN